MRIPLLRSSLILIAAAIFSFASYAGDSVSLRLVEASNSSDIVSAELSDVAATLQKNLPFRSLKLLDSKMTAVPAANSRITMAGGYVIVCNGPQDKLQISISKGKKEMVTSTVELQDQVPLFIGGFPAGESRILLVLISK
tara:strand:+ start:255 stop:674 length:420 start_codon:yes stop_codon:yes gene_type:complete